MFRRDELEMLRESDRENAHRDWGKARRFAKALNLQHKMVELVGHAHDAPADALAATEGTPAAAPSPTPSPLISPVATCEGLEEDSIASYELSEASVLPRREMGGGAPIASTPTASTPSLLRRFARRPGHELPS